jgi:serine/threonine-protein kinase
MVDSEDLSGRRLAGRYLVVRRIGAGGMGAVYEGLQEDLRRRVAIKVLRGDLAKSDVLVERFRREALAAAGLGHPHIVQVTDFQRASAGDPPFLVMELLAGRSMQRAVEELWPEKMSLTRLARIAIQMLGALDAAHRAGIIHRDIKPDNVLLCDTNVGADLVKVLDFGVAKLRDEEEAETGTEPLTREGAVLGTPAYMASEQALGLADVDARADVYGVGACLYFASTGKAPIAAPRPRDFDAIAAAEVPRLATLRPDLDLGFTSIVDRALRKSRDARFASAARMQAALERWIAGEPPLDVADTVPEAVVTRSATDVPAALAPTETAPTVGAHIPSPTTLVAREAPTPGHDEPPASSPETTLSAAASSTLASPGHDRRAPERRFPKGIAAIVLFAIAAVVVVRASSTPEPRVVSAPASATVSNEPPAPSSVEIVASVAPPPPAPSSAVVVEKPPPTAPRASAAIKSMPFDSRGTGAFLSTISAQAVRDCSRLDGPRTQTFLVRFGKDGAISEITPTFREPLSPAQTCIEDRLRGARTIGEGTTAVSVTLQPQPGAAPGFN